METFKDKHVVVTGGAGFVGSHLVEALLQQGAEVVVLDDMSRGKTHIPGAQLVRLDMGNPESCAHYLRGADCVFNLAADVAGILHNRAHQAEMFWNNMRLQAAPVIAAAKANVGRFVQVSSVCVYSPAHQARALEAHYGTPLSEQPVDLGRLGEPARANSGYSWSKRMGERVVEWAGLDYVIVRPANMYGPRDYFDERAHVIPAMIRRALSDENPVMLHGNGREVRDFLYVTDAAVGIMQAGLRGRAGNVYNLGSSGRNAISMHGLWTKILALTGMEEKGHAFIGDDGGDDRRVIIASKAYGEFGWEPRVELDEGLQTTLDWYKGRSHD